MHAQKWCQPFPTSSEPVLPGISSGVVYVRSLWLKLPLAVAIRYNHSGQASNGKHLPGKKTLILIAHVFCSMPYVPCVMCPMQSACNVP